MSSASIRALHFFNGLYQPQVKCTYMLEAMPGAYQWLHRTKNSLKLVKLLWLQI